jgi:hypothetical protein
LKDYNLDFFFMYTKYLMKNISINKSKKIF